MASTFTNLLYHVIFSTKNRERTIKFDIQDELYRYIGGILKNEGGILLAAGGIADHVHILVKLKPVHALSDMVRLVKGNSSKWLNEKKRLSSRFAWQEGYGAFSVSESQLPTALRYIKEQHKHHEKLSFKDELSIILARHRIEYDERHI